MKLIISREEKSFEEMPGLIENLGSYSITPTSFAFRSFDNKEDIRFLDKYSYKTNEVIRFGIYSNKIPIAIISETSGTLEVEIQGQKLAVVLEDKEKASQDSSSSAAGGGQARSKDSSSKMSRKYLEENANSVIHHDIEIGLMKDAVSYLLESDKRTALVDIFERSAGAIKLTNGKLEVHTVLLYKNPALANDKHDIIVIDPSNFLYSSHLKSSDILAKVIHSKLNGIKTLHKSVQIYKAPDKDLVGPKPDQFRDCIDIAVKLAFGFNSSADHQFIDLEQITINKSVKMMSNQITIDKEFIKTELPVRIKQSSDFNEIEKFLTIEKLVNKKIDLVTTDLFDKRVQFEVQTNHLKILEGSYNSLCIKSFIDYNHYLSDLLFTTLKNADEELLKILGEQTD